MMFYQKRKGYFIKTTSICMAFAILLGGLGISLASDHAYLHHLSKSDFKRKMEAEALNKGVRLSTVDKYLKPAKIITVKGWCGKSIGIL